MGIRVCTTTEVALLLRLAAAAGRWGVPDHRFCIFTFWLCSHSAAALQGPGAARPDVAGAGGHYQNLMLDLNLNTSDFASAPQRR